MQNVENINEFRRLALIIRDSEIQKKLLNHTDMGVRRNLALNQNITKEIANKLVEETIANVAYVASKNRNATIEKKFREEDIKHKCVICDADDVYLKCTTCDKKNK